MATQQYGYGRTAWDSIADQLVVEIPTLNQPGGAAAQFKAKNPLAAAAAKMVGEMAYGAQQEKAAPKFIGRDDELQKDIYEWQPNSEKFAPEGGWQLPPGSVKKSNLAIERKERQIAEAKLKSQFESESDTFFGERGIIGSDGNFVEAPSDETRAAFLASIVPEVEEEVVKGDNNKIVPAYIFDDTVQTQYEYAPADGIGNKEILSVSNYNWGQDPDGFLTNRYNSPMTNKEFRATVPVPIGKIPGGDWVWKGDPHWTGLERSTGEWKYEQPRTSSGKENRFSKMNNT